MGPKKDQEVKTLQVEFGCSPAGREKNYFKSTKDREVLFDLNQSTTSVSFVGFSLAFDNIATIYMKQLWKINI